MAALALYFLVLRLIGKKQRIGHIVVSFVFCFYLVGILALTGVCIRGTFSPNIVYIPFADMIRGPVQTALNLLLFVPLGFFLPILYQKFDQFGKIALAAFLVSLSVEVAQMFGTGTSDVNDLITNTLGACLGFGIYKLLAYILPKGWIPKLQAEGALCYFETALFWIGTLLLMLTVQPLLYHTFFAG